MNKRARLTRRILRDHYQLNWPWHMTRMAGGIRHHWTCPHCGKGSRAVVPEGAPLAYR